MAFVTFENVQKSYDGKNLVVKDLNLTVAKGEFLTMLGPSGSGKTTCLMMLAGFETPTYGKILLGDRLINNIPPHKRDIGMVFQNYALFPHLSVAENVGFPLTVRKLNKAEIVERVKKALEMVQMENFSTRLPAQLSGGQQQRIALARALVFDPELVLMDEPLGALDKQLREHMQYEIKRLHERLGITVVYVTHDQSEALTMSKRVAVFDDGVIQQLSAPDELYERPLNAFVAQFIGENNRFNGEVVEIDKNKKLCSVKLDDGTMVKAFPIAVDTVGQKTMISLRPERIEIAPDKSMDVQCAGKVLELIYLGDHIRVRMLVAGNDEFIAKIRNRQDRHQLEINQDVIVGWYSSDCRALDA